MKLIYKELTSGSPGCSEFPGPWTPIAIERWFPGKDHLGETTGEGKELFIMSGGNEKYDIY
jgi:hypothetical protein